MTGETARVELVIVGRDEASAAVRALTESFTGLERKAKALQKAFSGGIGAELSRQFGSLDARAKALGSGMTAAGDAAIRSLRAETAAARELAGALRDVAQAQGAATGAARSAASAGSASTRATTTSTRQAAQRARQDRDEALRDVRSRWRIREASDKAEASAAATKLRAESDAFATKLRNSRYLMGVRERSEAAELRHLGAVRREREAQRRHTITAGRHLYRHGRDAIRSLNHPAFESAGFWLTAGAAFGVEAGRHLLMTARAVDTATTRYSMMPGVTPVDAAKVRADALREGMRIGLDPAEVVRLQLQGLKDGLSPAIAKSLPAIVNAAVQTMGGSIERDGDELAKAVREAGTVGWVRDPNGARSLMNQVAGLSTFNGNSPEKMQQFLASGGIGRGAELGWSQQQTLAFGAALNGAGERTGFGSARLMAQISEIRASMRDRYVKAIRSHEPTEENRAIRSAPRLLGYGSITDMQGALASPEGLSSLFARLSGLDEKTRAAIEKGYGLGPQFNAVLAEMGAHGGARYHDALRREQELSAQKPESDDLSKNSRLWSGSIEAMVGRLKATATAVQAELGDVIKDDILAPFTGWWTEIGGALLDGGIKADFHRTLMAFVHGLGFEDVAAMLRGVSSNVRKFDFAGFARGLGEGVRAMVDDLRALGRTLGYMDMGDGRALGKLTAELFGLSLGLRVMSPVITLIGGFASAVLAVKAAVELGGWIAKLTGLSEGLGAIAALDLAGAAAAIATFTGSLALLIGTAKLATDKGMLQPPKSWNWRGFLDFLDPNLGNLALGKQGQAPGDGMTGGDFTKGPHGGLLRRQSYDGGAANWRDLLQPAAYITGDASAGDRDRTTAAMIGTSRAAQRIADRLDELAPRLSLMTTASAASSVGGEGGGGSMGGAGRIMRWAGHAAGDNLGNSATPARGALAANQREAFAAARAAGLSETAARALVANMSGESLAQPGNYHWDRKHMSGGIVQWDPQRAAAIHAKFGKNPWEMSVSEQTKAAVWEIQNNPRFAQTARALQGNDSGAMMSALVRNYESPANPGAAIMRRMGYFRGFNPNASAGGGAGEAAGELHLASRVLGEQCVDLAKAAVGATGSVKAWRKGVLAEVGNLVPGTPVATFLDRMGRESARYAGGGTGTMGAHLDHAGIFKKYIMDATGKRIGMQIAEQYKGSGGAHLKNYMFGQGWGEGNGSNYHAILGPDGQPLGGTNNPLSTPNVAGITKGVPTAHHGAPAPHAASAPHRMDMAQAAPITIHAPVHVHGVTDPHHLARIFSDHIEGKTRSRYADSEVG